MDTSCSYEKAFADRNTSRWEKIESISVTILEICLSADWSCLYLETWKVSDYALSTSDFAQLDSLRAIKIFTPNFECSFKFFGHNRKPHTNVPLEVISTLWTERPESSSNDSPRAWICNHRSHEHRFDEGIIVLYLLVCRAWANQKALRFILKWNGWFSSLWLASKLFSVLSKVVVATPVLACVFSLRRISIIFRCSYNISGIWLLQRF